MGYNNHISETLFRAHDYFDSAEAGGPRSRYKSWEYCHKIFFELHKKGYENLSDADFDYLALNLAFFLASWGMYCRSSFLLQRDYKAHIPAVKIIMKDEYDGLWDFDPSSGNIDEAYSLLFGNETNGDGLYRKLKVSYSGGTKRKDSHSDLIKIEDESRITTKEAKSTDTLITKILLVTFACIPAFDTFFKRACNKVNPSISGKPEKAFRDLCKFAKIYRQELRFECIDIYNPPMKVLDLYFWRVGIGLSLQKEFNAAVKTNDEKKKKSIVKIMVGEKYVNRKTKFNISENKISDINFPKGIEWR